MIKYSVIIPVYNTEKYLRRCLDSICAYDGALEIIALDDGSTDGSLALLRAYPDQRLRVVEKENEGAFRTWKRGVELSAGEYIVFVDSNDYVSKALFPALDKVFRAGGYDLVQFGWTSFRDAKKGALTEEPYPAFAEGEYRGEALLEYQKACVFENSAPDVYATARARWGKAFRAEKLKALLPRLMDLVYMFEDDSAVIPYLTGINSLYLLRQPLYFYRIGRQGSVCNSPEKLETYLHDAGAVANFLSAPEWGISAKALDAFYEYYHVFVLWLAIMSKKDLLAAKILDDKRLFTLLSAKKGLKFRLLRKKKFRTYRLLRRLKHLF